jgi:hypothetical protein
MADKRRFGQVVPLGARRKRRNTPPLDVSTRDMIEAEQALFSALRSTKRPTTPGRAVDETAADAAREAADQAETQPPPSTSSSRKKTAA